MTGANGVPEGDLAATGSLELHDGVMGALARLGVRVGLPLDPHHGPIGPRSDALQHHEVAAAPAPEREDPEPEQRDERKPFSPPRIEFAQRLQVSFAGKDLGKMCVASEHR